MVMEQASYNFWSLIVYTISAVIALWMLKGVKGQIKEAVESNCRHSGSAARSLCLPTDE